MNKIILHIGLPKTGTTTLQQDVFPYTNSNYIGVRQPRSLPQPELWSLIIDFVSGVNSANEETIRAQLTSMLKTKPVLLSEEMFLVDYNEVTWQDKTQRLANLVSGFDVEILVTLREPFAAVTSYYKEVFSSYRYDFFDFICNSNAALIYQYQALFKHLEQVFKEVKIHRYAFEDILIDDGYKEMLISLDLESEKTIDLGVRNSRVRHSPIVIQRKNVIAKLLSKIKCEKSSFVQKIIDCLTQWNTRSILLNTHLAESQKAKVNSLLTPAKLVWNSCLRKAQN